MLKVQIWLCQRIVCYKNTEQSLNYSDTAGSAWFCSKDEANISNANINANNANNVNIITNHFKSL